MNNNRLAVLLQLSKSVYGAPLNILPSLLTRMQFNGESQYKIHDYLIWQTTKYPSNGTMADSTRSIIYIPVLFSLIWESCQQCQP
jgi:hypothetical protein